MENLPQTYYCNNCETEKDLFEFAIDRSRKRGHCSTCKQCKREYCKKIYHKRKHDISRRFSHGVCAARKKNREWSFTLDQYESIIKDSQCYYCDKDLSLEVGYSLDRIDNSKGYIEDNVLPCCANCNLTRQDRFSVEEWKVAMRAIIDFRLGEGHKDGGV